MPDLEKALQLLRDVRGEVDPDMGGLCDNDCKTVSAWLDEAIALLDDAVEPKETYDIYECGACGWPLCWAPGMVKYCANCGRRVKWDG